MLPKIHDVEVHQLLQSGWHERATAERLPRHAPRLEVATNLVRVRVGVRVVLELGLEVG